MGVDQMWKILLLCVLTAVSNAQCSNTTTTIRGYADTVPLSACKTFTGVIAVATDSEPVIELNGVQKIEGSFIATDNAGVTTLASDSLVETTGKVEFSNLEVLANLSLPRWQSTAILVMDRIPSPTYTNFQQKGQQINELYVRNTTFAFFSGLTLVGAQIEVLEIVDNKFLQLISFMAGNITKSATITGNGGGLELHLPALTYAYSLDISNASKIDLPMLSSVSDGLDASYNDAIEVSAPELTYVGGNLVLSNNPNLDTLEFKQLVNVQGDLDITDNKALRELDGLPYLSSVGGDMKLTGAFDRIELPSLGIVHDDIVIKSKGSLNCSDVSASLAGASYQCTGDTRSSDTRGSEDGGSNGLSVGAKAGIAIGAIAVVVAVAALVFFIWTRQRRRRQSQSSPEDQPHHEAQQPAASQEGNSHEAANDRKEHFEMEYYGIQPSLDGGSQKGLVLRDSEMGRASGEVHVGPESRHELYNTRDQPAAHELPAVEIQRQPL